MRKLKVLVTYLVAIICMITALFFQPKQIEVFHTSTNQMDDSIMIYMMDEENILVPITLTYQKNEDDQENIKTMFQMMKQEFDIYDLTKLIPDSIHCLDVNVVGNIVQIHLNEAFYAMNSKIEFRFIEGIVSSVVQLNEKYEVEFYVNDEKVKQMPLSQLPMTTFNSSLGVNNFKVDVLNLHNSIPKQVVYLKNNDEIEYYVVSTKRISNTFNQLEFVNDVLRDISYDLECFKIEQKGNEVVLHLNNKFLLEEDLVDESKVMALLYTLKMNQMGNDFTIKVNDEIMRINGYPMKSLRFDDLNLNVFEE